MSAVPLTRFKSRSDVIERTVRFHQGLRSRAAYLAAAASRLNSAGGEIASRAPFNLAFLTDRRRAPHPEIILRALPSGAAVIYRDYDDPARPAVAARLAAMCKARGLHLAVGSDAALAAKVGAAVHLPSRLLRRSGVDLSSAVSASCHSIADIELAASIGVRIIFLSPVFATESHPGSDFLGARNFLSLARKSPLPVLAMGGVDERNAALLHGTRVAGIGAIGAFLAR